MKQLHSAQEAIEQAIEGGWEAGRSLLRIIAVDNVGLSNSAICRGLCDPLFWQALGRARRWIDENYPDGEMRCHIKVNGEQRCEDRYCSYAGFRDPKKIALQWFSNRMVGGDEQKFWESLP